MNYSSEIGKENMEFGEWAVERVLGSGTFGKVILFRSKISGEKIAVKKCHNDTTVNAELWKKEIKILYNLEHPGLVSGVPMPTSLLPLSKGLPVLCMEYCSGGDLRQMLNKPSNCCGLPEKDVLDILREVSSAVLYLHSVRLVHRDLKPENIVIQLVDRKKVYKLIDLGYAKELNKQSLCSTFVGTVQYLAPEMFYSEKYSCTVDYWSLGCIVFECITGVRPFFPGLPPIQWMQHVESKSHQDIRVFQHSDGSIIYSPHLPKENQINSVLKSHLEEWLRLMLDWNPALRGRRYQDPSNPGPVVAFDMLEDIFQTKVVTLFGVDDLTDLSYAVNQDTTVEDIQQCFERDTGVSCCDQLMILPRGISPSGERMIGDMVVENEPITAFLFSKLSNGSEMRVVQNYPELVSLMLSNPRMEIEYRKRKQMWAQSLYFVLYQTLLYRKLLNALKVLSTHLTLRLALVKQQMKCLKDSLSEVTSYHELFTSSLKLDQHNHKLQSQRGGLPSCTLVDKWSQQETAVSRRLNELESAYNLLDQPLVKVTSLMHDTAKAAEVFLSKPSDALDICYQAASDLYINLQQSSKELVGNSVAMTKAVVKTLKIQQAVFTECFTQIRVAEECSMHIDTFSPQLLVLKQDIDQFHDRMLSMQTQRQNDVWTLLERAVTMWQHASIMNQPNANAPPPDSNLLSIPSLSLVGQNTAESSTIIQENQSLRYGIQDSLSQSLSSLHRSRQEEFDWSFLDN